MAASTLAIFLCYFLSVSAEIQPTQVCQMDDALAVCVYTDKGVYGSSVVVRTITRIQFDRLTESVLSLKNLPNVNLVTQDNPFERRKACQLIRDNVQQVIVQSNAPSYLELWACYRSPADTKRTNYRSSQWTSSTVTKATIHWPLDNTDEWSSISSADQTKVSTVTDVTTDSTASTNTEEPFTTPQDHHGQLVYLIMATVSAMIGYISN